MNTCNTCTYCEIIELEKFEGNTPILANCRNPNVTGIDPVDGLGIRKPCHYARQFDQPCGPEGVFHNQKTLTEVEDSPTFKDYTILVLQCIAIGVGLGLLGKAIAYYVL